MKDRIYQSQIIFKKGIKYLYGDEKYKFSEFGPILKIYPDIYSNYERAVRRTNMTRNSLSFFTFLSGDYCRGHDRLLITKMILERLFI